ncbi:BNR repeat-containing protein [Catenovulum sp. SX2]|uniref:BNR repeat-containing protein n=1 Tax=Catenovulum sp. SX2 TaxID=3398614 RepID=UPI003F84218E
MKTTWKQSRRLKTWLTSVTLLSLAALQACSQLSDLSTKQAVRILPISDQAFAGSSVNVLAGVKQTVYTHGEFQYAAFYNRQAKLVLAKRNIAQDSWQLHTTEFSGNVNDAHNHISIVVDGAGYLHMAWDHHNNPLNYAKSTAPGSLQLQRANMLGNMEKSVTYPQFYALKNGDLLFQYRDGGSGKGQLVMNRYHVAIQSWSRIHNVLIDGEKQRSAYWDMTLDQNDVLHLAWIWRETPDVATNHDLMYAQSKDYGVTWQQIDGAQYKLPLRINNAQVVKQIPQNHKLMNPPVVAADNSSNPYITSYWADAPEQAPAFNVVRFDNGKWQTFTGPKASVNFALSGMGTKNPPWSRPVLLVDSDSHTSWFHLIHRDDTAAEIKVHTVKPSESTVWHSQSLIDKTYGAWEPSIDPQQWQRFKQLHMLVQSVEQQDGNDAKAADVQAEQISLATWQVN